MSKILTVKVAAYNVEKYIEKCLDSFTDERYRDELQVIVVNNQCPDNTLMILRKYEEKYPDLFMVVAQENQGYASTFNVGFEHANGKYFMYVDGDDWLTPEELYQHINILKKCDSDLVVSNLVGVYEKNGKEKKCTYSGKNAIGQIYEFDKAFFPEKIIPGAHPLTVKTALLKEGDLKVHIENNIPEVEYELWAILHAKTVLYTGLFLYHYRTGIDTQASNAKNLVRVENRMYSAALMFADWLEQEENLSQGQYEYFTIRVGGVFAVLTRIELLYPLSFERWKKIRALLKEVKNKNIKIYEKIHFSSKMLYWGTPIYYVVIAVMYRIYKKYHKWAML